MGMNCKQGIQYRTLLGKGGKSGALGENNVTKRELCNENR